MTEDARDYLRKLFPKGSTVYTILRNVNRAGTVREIGVIGVPGPNEVRQPNHDVAEILDLRLNERGDGLKVKGGGMDMGYKIAHDLGRELYEDGRALSHSWL